MITQPLTADELAALLRVSVPWIYRECRAGRMPHTRVARQIRFTEDHVRQILAAGEPTPVVTPITRIRARRIA